MHGMTFTQISAYKYRPVKPIRDYIRSVRARTWILCLGEVIRILWLNSFRFIEIIFCYPKLSLGDTRLDSKSNNLEMDFDSSVLLLQTDPDWIFLCKLTQT